MGFADFIGWTSMKSAACWLAHSKEWRWLEQINDEIDEYYCPKCDEARWTRVDMPQRGLRG